MKNNILTLCLALLSITTFGTLKAENEKPFVIPELRHWQGAEGVATINTKSKVLYTDVKLQQVAEAMGEDYALMFGKKLKTKATKELGKNSAGNIIITLTNDKELGDEGYTITISNDVTVSANTPTGAYWATRTLLQILEQNDGKQLPKGNVRDWPDYAVRGYMIDVGRKYIPLEYLEKYAKIMAYYKMNTFQIHLNDKGVKVRNDSWDDTYAGFRLESEFFPELTAKDGHYTKDAFRQFQKDAAKIHVNVIPEIDAPAHSLCFTRFREEYAAKEYGMDHLNLFNPEVYTFLDSLFTEYLSGDDPVFVGKNVHIGTDEYSNKDKAVVEKFRAFTDHYIRFVESFGKKAYLWGALTHAKGETPVKAENVTMECWYVNYADPAEMKKLGYKIISIPSRYVYLVPAAPYYFDYLNHKNLYNSWTPATINQHKFEELDPCLLGGMFAVWNDLVGNGITVDDIHHRTIPATQVLSACTWSPTYKKVPFNEFDTKRNKLSEAPGVNELAQFKGEANSIVYNVSKVKPGKKYSVSEAGFFHTISFHIDGAKEDRGTKLFSNNETDFYLSSPIDGRMAFARDGYLCTFDYYVEEGKSADIKIECTNATTRLYVNGKLKDDLKREKRWISEKEPFDFIQTLHFPLQQAGKFKSNITNLEVKKIK